MTALCFGSFANMELVRSCALVFVIATSLASGTPHGYGGYGVKTGAAAKAQAGAVAGAFTGAGTFPLAIPPGGAGYSGSYSKSSSSSFASSSASASSSSFSYSGSGTLGGGCTSGVCPNAGPGNGLQPSDNNINGFHSNNGANGAAAAQAGALAGSQYSLQGNSGSPCSGYDCNQKGTGCNGSNGPCGPIPATSDSNGTNKDKCTNGQCGAGTTSSTQSTGFTNGNNNLNPGDSNNNKCTSGNCDAPGTIGISSPDYNSPDKGPSSQYRPVFGQNTNIPSDYGSGDKPNKCTSEQCGPTSAKDGSSPNYSPSKCSSGQCNPTGEGPATSDDIPVNFTGGSSSTSNYASDNDKSSSAGISSTPGCVSGNCGSIPSLQLPAQILPHGTVNTYPQPNYSKQNKDTPACNSPNCNNNDFNPYASAAVGASSPVYNKPVPFLTTPKQQPSCTSPNCQSPAPGQYPSGFVITGTYPSASGPPGQYPFGSVSGTDTGFPSNPNPACSGGKCGSVPISTSSGNPAPSSSFYPSTQYEPSGTKCTTSNCGSNNVPNTPSYKPPQSSSQTITPSGIPNKSPSLNYGPSSSGSPQGYQPSPTDSLSPTRPTLNDVSSAHPQGYQPTKPSYSSSLPTAPNPSEPNNSNDDGSIPPFVPLRPSSSANCEGNSCSSTPSTRPNYGLNSIPTQSSPVTSGQPSGSKPNYGLNPLPPYPGPHNSGVPPSSTGPSYGPTSAPIQTHPITGITGQTIQPSAPNYVGPHSTASSNAGSHTNKPEISYLGGFGGPSGLLKPNEFTVSNNNIPAGNKPTTGGQIPCSTGNCGNPQQSLSGAGSTIGVQAGSHNTAVSAPCTTGKCGSSPTEQSNFNFNGAHAAAGAVASANAVAYSGGFGGPPGFLSPFDDGKLGSSLPTLNGKGGPTGPHSALNVGLSTYNHGIGGGVQAGGAAQAVAGASAGAIAGAPYGHAANGGHGAGGGCGGGCGGSGSYGAGRSLGLHGGLDHSKDGPAGLYGGFGASLAGAKAGAASFGGSFASAHASAGAAVKGGHYGRR